MIQTGLLIHSAAQLLTLASDGPKRGEAMGELGIIEDGAFAADFAEQLYAHLLAGEPLGESLLATRRYFLEKYNNPSGLLYSMYALPSIRLQHMSRESVNDPTN